MNDDLTPLLDADAEAGVLAAFITRPDSRQRIVAEVHERAIAHTPYAAVWRMLREMHAAGESIDPSTVRREVRRRQLGVADTEIRDVFREHASDAATDVGRVVDWYRRRWTVEKMDAMRAAAIDPQADFMGDLSRFTGSVDQLVRRAGRLTPRPGGIDRLEARLEGMITGRIKNLAWPSAPNLTRIARPLESGSILMLGGPPGDGKSFWMIGSMREWIRAGERPVVCMLEKSDDWHLMRAFAIAAGEPDLSRSEWYEGSTNRHQIARAFFAEHREEMTRLAASIFEAREVGDSLPDLARWVDAQADENNIIIVDPISLADAGDKRWVADRNFITSCIRTCERTDARIILITHPNSAPAGVGGPRLANLMGGLVYQRQTDSVLYIEKHEPAKQFEVIRYLVGQPMREIVKANRTVTAFKARNGGGGPKKFAFYWDPATLQMCEQGVVLKEKRGQDDDENEN